MGTVVPKIGCHLALWYSRNVGLMYHDLAHSASIPNYLISFMLEN